MMQWNIDGLGFSYGSHTIFDNFTLSCSADKRIAILGPSGCGKTSLLHLLAGLRVPDSGRIQCSEEAKVSFVFQESRLLPWLNVVQNVALPIEKKLGKKAALETALQYLSLVGIEDKKDSMPSALSGGQKQRVALARAFAFPSHTILMDEPFQSLDLPLRIQLMDVTLSMLEAEPRLLIAVTHDPREAIYLSDRILVLSRTPAHIVMDEEVRLSRMDRAYSSKAPAELEARLFSALQ